MLVRPNLPIDILKIIEGFLVAYNPEVHTLSYLVENNNLQGIKFLVSRGVDITANDDRAIRIASYKGHLDVLKYLISLGANIKATNNHCVINASYTGHLEVVKYLVSLGAYFRADEALREACIGGFL